MAECCWRCVCARVCACGRVAAVCVMERPAKRQRADVFYVTDMHTGRELEFAGAQARSQARGRMIAGSYFDPAAPMTVLRADASGSLRLATQSEKGGLSVCVRPSKTRPGGVGLSEASFEHCCICSAEGCHTRCLDLKARGPKRDVEAFLRARENHRRSQPAGVHERCLYLRCDACALAGDRWLSAPRGAVAGGGTVAGDAGAGAAVVKRERGAGASAVAALVGMVVPGRPFVAPPWHVPRSFCVRGPGYAYVKPGERATVTIDRV